MNKTSKILSTCSIVAIAMVTCTAFSATTTAARPSIASTTATRAKVTGGASTSRMPTTTTATQPSAQKTVTKTPEPEPEPEQVIVVDNKTSQFNEILSDIAGIAPDTSSADLAERVRQQRALLDSAGKQTSAPTSSGTTGANACDSGLRKCMSEKCGNDFTKCANDSTTIWGDKMDSCRRTTKCTGHEYTLLAPEILADRDMNIKISYYNSVLNCGNRYNNCIFTECGKHLDKCLAKSDGDRAISKCESIARECREQDNGLAARVMSAFGDLRTVATANVQKQEQRLYELRDLMRAQCNRLGAIFDERTLDCVYTVNFFAGDDTETPKASKKLYAGDVFQCNPNWFGVDVTTFKENAYRLTRAQTSASAAALGAGVGTAAGIVSSDALGRALETQKAKSAMDDARATEQAAQQQQQQGDDNQPTPPTTGSAPTNSPLTKSGGMGYDERATGTNINYKAASSQFGNPGSSSPSGIGGGISNSSNFTLNSKQGFSQQSTASSNSNSSQNSSSSGGGTSERPNANSQTNFKNNDVQKSKSTNIYKGLSEDEF